ncbi:Tyrosine-protein phosphatase YwqE [Poriferisphaera corsica]|uniref:protein-tyrosine-phosphatase n=1 Tax=Poriferisphaera corsica TaxID=2528020 RepID=A0A517YSA2_9BACT|nr:CpsB/CapC family capsule biosynthesis tyrosine phosphatase [Poriferisphaera corsica]QDU33109.1 Tyrosine-protein phosphatase YwqE [Poriferisphaera corsica]
MSEEQNNGEALEVPRGRIDIHCHLIPGVDDGCMDVDESVAIIEELKLHGYVGSICTPHIWREMFPMNGPGHIERWVEQLKGELSSRGVQYELWAGGEIRLHKKVIEEWQQDGVMTLAGSKYVLVDFWEGKWSRWVNKAFEYLLGEGYVPILAHPERLPEMRKIDKYLDTIMAEGVLLQGNFQCFTGEAGYTADVNIRRWMEAGYYTFLATDAHRPDSIFSRIDGIDIAMATYSQQRIREMADTKPRELILGIEPTSADQQ